VEISLFPVIKKKNLKRKLRHTTMSLTKWDKGLTVFKIHAQGAR